MAVNAPMSMGRKKAFMASETMAAPEPEPLIILVPSRFARPVPKMVKVSPATFWFAFKVTVRKA